MTDLQLANYLSRFQADAKGSGLAIEPPPLSGWRTHPWEGHPFANQRIRREHRPAVPGPKASSRRSEDQKRRKVRHQVDPSLRKTFESHVKRWRDETETLSSVSDIALHPAYQRIIGLGAPVLPLIFRELEASLDHWFWALHAISDENPVPPEEQGDMEAMRERWLRWGRERDLIQ